MNLHQILPPERVKMRLAAEPPQPEEGEPALSAATLRAFKEQVLAELVELLDRSGRVGNPAKLLRDLINRERKASTAVGRGIAFPHVHSLQAREMIAAVALAPEGIPFDAPDGAPVHLLVAMVAPSHDNRLYLNLVRRFAEMFRGDAVLPEVLAARDEHEVIRILGGYL